MTRILCKSQPLCPSGFKWFKATLSVSRMHSDKNLLILSAYFISSLILKESSNVDFNEVPSYTIFTNSLGIMMILLFSLFGFVFHPSKSYIPWECYMFHLVCTNVASGKNISLFLFCWTNGKEVPNLSPLSVSLIF